MIGSLDVLSVLAFGILVPVLVGITLLAYLAIKYVPVIGENFEKQPLFMPLRVSPTEQGESVIFATADGLKLAGTYLRARTERLAGVLVYCHEYLSDRWSFHPYLDHLRDLGYDIFTFDFRNHGASGHEAGYSPMQWTSDREVLDLRAALHYLRSRPDHDPAGFGLFGVSRGGTTALITAAVEPSVWGVITDGAFPTRGTMVPYTIRWAEIYVQNAFLLGLFPLWVFDLLAWLGRRWSERRQNCRFPAAESAVGRLAPRPWLMIHGERDTYIGPGIARKLFARGSGPKELWLVPEAKHNRCREANPEAYAAHVRDFLKEFAPRRPLSRTPRPTPLVVAGHGVHSTNFSDELAPADLRGQVVSPMSG